MKRRIGCSGATGLGGGTRQIMDGQPSGNKKKDEVVRQCSKDAYETFFKGTEMDFNYCDADIDSHCVTLGIEPSYMYERLKIIVIEEQKEMSKMVTGYAWGAWGSDIRQSERYYKLYKTKSKFIKFIDKWHPLLFKVK